MFANHIINALQKRTEFYTYFPCLLLNAQAVAGSQELCVDNELMRMLPISVFLEFLTAEWIFDWFLVTVFYRALKAGKKKKTVLLSILTVVWSS